MGDFCLYVLAIFLPPVAVIFKKGCSGSVLVNILLDCLGWVPGVLHAWFVIYSTPSRRSERPPSRYDSRYDRPPDRYDSRYDRPPDRYDSRY